MVMIVSWTRRKINSFHRGVTDSFIYYSTFFVPIRPQLGLYFLDLCGGTRYPVDFSSQRSSYFNSIIKEGESQ